MPEHVTGQGEISERAYKLYPQYAPLEALYTNTGMSGATRSSRSTGICRRTPGKSEHSLTSNTRFLLQRVAVQSVAEAGLSLRDIDVIVTNTITGLTIPSLEARLMNRLDFRRMSSGCRSSGSVAAVALPASRVRRAWRRRGPGLMCCSSPSTCVRYACASTTRASPCSLREHFSAMAQRVSSCVAPPVRAAFAGCCGYTTRPY